MKNRTTHLSFAMAGKASIYASSSSSSLRSFSSSSVLLILMRHNFGVMDGDDDNCERRLTGDSN